MKIRRFIKKRRRKAAKRAADERSRIIGDVITAKRIADNAARRVS